MDDEWPLGFGDCGVSLAPSVCFYQLLLLTLGNVLLFLVLLLCDVPFVSLDWGGLGNVLLFLLLLVEPFCLMSWHCILVAYFCDDMAALFMVWHWKFDQIICVIFLFLIVLAMLNGIDSNRDMQIQV